MKLQSLLESVETTGLRGPKDVDVLGISADSRRVRAGWLFVAVPGHAKDGAVYVQEAVERGAAAVISVRKEWVRRDICHIQVADARRAAAQAAAAFHGRPADRLETFGVTGTNGKTTVAYMLRDLLAAADRRPGLVGTVVYEVGSRRIPATRTTPDAIELQALLGQMVGAGCQSVAMEVSSHALDQDRVHGIPFDAAIFTNLTQDHLDYHGTMEQYFEAKARLFAGPVRRGAPPPAAVISMDDAWGRQLAARVRAAADRTVLTFSLQNPAADVYAEHLVLRETETALRIRSPWGATDVVLPLPGRYNAANVLAAFTAGGARGLEPDLMARVLGRFQSAPGRLEPVPNTRGVRVLVDYAHTEDALANLLSTLRETTAGRLIVVFGCGGDRDRTKRPRMGAAALRFADYAVVTSDNPRSEDPVRILADVTSGMSPPERFEQEPDRARAIARALELARKGDTVVIAGKGHETYQELAHTMVPFDDRDVARRALEGG